MVLIKTLHLCLGTQRGSTSPAYVYLIDTLPSAGLPEASRSAGGASRVRHDFDDDQRNVVLGFDAAGEIEESGLNAADNRFRRLVGQLTD